MRHRSALLALHLGALLFGLSGIFGKLALAAPLAIVCGRALFAVAALLPFARTDGNWLRPSWRRRLALAGAGLLLGGHWWSFFVAVKVSGVAVATLGFASFPAFTVLLEGLLFRERVRAAEWGVVALVSLGLVLVSPSLDLGSQASLGLAWAVLSGLLFALVSVSNRATTPGVKPAQAALWQNLAILACSLPLAWSQLPAVRALDWLWIALLGLLCTALAHSLFVASLRVLNARSASVVFALEPVYGIGFAWWLFGERPGLRMLAGGALILLATLLSARLSRHAPRADDLE
ncbi:DMT family transporter [Azotobacter beijerinckii]|uniref:EamA domain-containing membrane protein RarD n=1 Tax=Azotobacter beijerinckii TaxID=170623 RepID=A0A1I3YXA1_9GAMM|nr:DMT family transporter [Azotobacter beijerinckii]SFA75757.1 EamA domain-containing membrane protein RarD [Azotobacter beijerinckii]SFK36487.1 EamA domain-containing membrane protein RarD [Azotobacter beijerinckii]